MRIFVYGSLMKGMFNNSMLKDSEFLGTHKLGGFVMFSFGAFPAAVMCDNFKREIIGELYECPLSAFLHIRDMELGAGYFEKKVKLAGRLATLYCYRACDIHGELVASGDWRSHVKEQRYFTEVAL